MRALLVALLLVVPPARAADDDGDGVPDEQDNCPTIANSTQLDADQDGLGNPCDNCVEAANPTQADADGDGSADACDTCPAVANPEQVDTDNDGIGNACDVCVRVVDRDQEDDDDDGVGNACDACPDTTADMPDFDLTVRLATDLDGCSVSDRCPCDGPPGTGRTWGRRRRYLACVRRTSRQLRQLGLIDWGERLATVHLARASDCARTRGQPGDRDGDGVPDDGDESGFAGDNRCTDGTIVHCDDNCPGTRNPGQTDLDGDAAGDACDPDIDGDGFPNHRDSCPRNADVTRADADGDHVGDVCDDCPDTPPAADVDPRGCADGEKPAGS